MRWFDRILLFFAAVGLLAFTAAFILIIWGHPGMLQWPSADSYWPYLATLLGLLPLLIVLRLFYLSLAREEQPSGVHMVNALGSMEISPEALSGLIQQGAKQVKGVSDLSHRLIMHEDGRLSVRLRVAVRGERPMPQLVEEVQYEVKEKLEKIAGVAVGEIHVRVGSVTSAPLPETPRPKVN